MSGADDATARPGRRCCWASPPAQSAYAAYSAYLAYLAYLDFGMPMRSPSREENKVVQSVT